MGKGWWLDLGHLHCPGKHSFSLIPPWIMPGKKMLPVKKVSIHLDLKKREGGVHKKLPPLLWTALS
jgi:hypothetical protein